MNLGGFSWLKVLRCIIVPKVIMVLHVTNFIYFFRWFQHLRWWCEPEQMSTTLSALPANSADTGQKIRRLNALPKNIAILFGYLRKYPPTFGLCLTSCIDLIIPPAFKNVRFWQQPKDLYIPVWTSFVVLILYFYSSINSEILSYFMQREHVPSLIIPLVGGPNRYSNPWNFMLDDQPKKATQGGNT